MLVQLAVCYPKTSNVSSPSRTARIEQVAIVLEGLGGTMKQGYLLSVVLVGATILGMRSGIADGVLALGYAKGGPIYGWAAGFSKDSADTATHALNECRGKYKCEVVATFHDQCFAISSNGTATKWASPIGFGL